MRAMKKFTLTFAILCALCALAYAGPEALPSGKEMKQVAPAPCPEWYADREITVSLWGAYAFVGTDSNRATIEQADDLNIFGTYDRFLAADHAWGGGGDVKFFFHRYFGVGIEGFGLTGHSLHGVTEVDITSDRDEFYEDNTHASGGVLGTLTLRYPIHCTRFSPYIWAGGGGMFGGRNDRPVVLGPPSDNSRFDNKDESRGMGQFGGGLEFRITPHIGLTGDFSWNVLDGPHNNFGLVRSGVTFSF
jgi:hypothetical protein